MFKKYKYWILGISLVLVANLGAFLYHKHQQDLRIDARVAAVTDQTDEHEQTESKYPGVHIQSQTGNYEDFRRVIQYPTFDSEELNDRIDDFLEQEVGHFEDAVQEHLRKLKTKETDVVPYFYANFKMYPFGDKLYSIVFRIEEFLGGATSETRTKIFLLDLADAQWIDPDETLNADELNEMEVAVGEKLSEQDALKDYYNEEYFNEFLKEHDLADSMYFTDDQVAFSFDRYTVAAGAAGNPEVTFTAEEFGEFLEPTFLPNLTLAENLTIVPKAKGADKWDQIKVPKVVTDNREHAGKKVALTFDDGPHPENTRIVLDNLKKHGAKATFFMLGTAADFYPQLVKEVTDAGHEIGGHSWTHREFTKLTNAEIDEEFALTDAAIEKVTDWHPQLFRPPYGDHNDAVDAAVGDRSVVLWSLDTLDWQSRNSAAILEKVKAGLHDGAIILMHDIHPETAQAVDSVAAYIKSQGYEMVTVSDLFADNDE